MPPKQRRTKISPQEWVAVEDREFKKGTAFAHPSAQFVSRTSRFHVNTSPTAAAPEAEAPDWKLEEALRRRQEAMQQRKETARRLRKDHPKRRYEHVEGYHTRVGEEAAPGVSGKLVCSPFRSVTPRFLDPKSPEGHPIQCKPRSLKPSANPGGILFSDGYCTYRLKPS